MLKTKAKCVENQAKTDLMTTTKLLFEVTNALLSNHRDTTGSSQFPKIITAQQMNWEVHTNTNCPMDFTQICRGRASASHLLDWDAV